MTHFPKRTQTEIAILSAKIIAKIFSFFYYHIAKYIIYPYFLFRDFRSLSLFFFFFLSLQRAKINFCIFHRFIIILRKYIRRLCLHQSIGLVIRCRQFLMSRPYLARKLLLNVDEKTCEKRHMRAQ